MLVKVDKFILHVDFIVLDMQEDRAIPIILGRPFLNTGKALIDVHEGKLILRIHDEQVTFNVFKALKNPNDDASCFRVDFADCLVQENFERSMPKDVLYRSLTLQHNYDEKEQEIEKCVAMLDSRPFYHHRMRFEELERKAVNHLKPSIEHPPELELKQLPS